LIDKAVFPRDKICAGAIGARGDRLLDGVGARVDVPQALVSGLSVRTRLSGLSVALPGAPIGRVVRRRAYDHRLLQLAGERGATVRTGVALRSFEITKDRALVHTDDGTLSAKVIVGADGVASRVRRQLDLPRGDYYAQAVEVDTPVTDGDATDTLHFDLTARELVGYLWNFPTVVDGRTLMCRGAYQLVRGAAAPSANASVGPKVAVQTALEQHLDRCGIDRGTLRFRRFAERGLSLHDPMSRSRVVLVGEAAGIDPVLGEGIAQGIMYGHAAAEYLAERWRRGLFHFDDYKQHILASRVGLDLRIRSRAARWVYGAARPRAEAVVVSSRHLAIAGMHYFAGRRVPRWRIAGAVKDVLSYSAASLGGALVP